MEKPELRKVIRWIDTFTKWKGYCIAPFCLLLVLITMYDIVGRQCGLFTAWAFDMEWFIYGFLLMFAMGYAIITDQHVRIDLLTTRFSPRTQSLLMAISYAVFVIPVMVLIAKEAWGFSMRAKEIHEVVFTAWYAPLWPVKLCIFIGICLMLPQSFAELIRNVYFVIKREKI